MSFKKLLAPIGAVAVVAGIAIGLLGNQQVAYALAAAPTITAQGTMTLDVSSLNLSDGGFAYSTNPNPTLLYAGVQRVGVPVATGPTIAFAAAVTDVLAASYVEFQIKIGRAHV